MKNKKLTFAESVMLVAGAGIGTGLLTIPYAISRVGIFGTLVALMLAYAVSAAMYLIIAELARNSQKSNDLLGILDEHLFGGKGKRVLNIVFLILLVLLLIENLVVYILCASSVFEDLSGVGGILSKLIFYAVASLVVMFGIKGIGIGEKISVWLIGAVVITLTVLAFFNVKGALNLSFGAPSAVFALYGLFMFAFSAIFSILQVCNHIEKPEHTGKAVICGLTLNAIITVIFTLAVIIGSESVTEIATVGLSDAIGMPFVKIICAIMILFAMLSSFWSSGLAFADIVGSQIKIPLRASWFIATLPALLISAFIPLTVLDYVQIGAGALSVILVIVVLPAYYNAARKSKNKLLLGKLATNKLFIVAVAVAVCLMAISSLIPIK